MFSSSAAVSSAYHSLKNWRCRSSASLFWSEVKWVRKPLRQVPGSWPQGLTWKRLARWHNCFSPAARSIQNLSNRFQARSGVGIDFSISGLLSVALNLEQQAELDRKKQQQTELGLEVQSLSREETLRMESGLNPELLSALYFPEEGYVDNRELVEAVRVGLLAARSAAGHGMRGSGGEGRTKQGIRVGNKLWILCVGAGGDCGWKLVGKNPDRTALCLTGQASPWPDGGCEDARAWPCDTSSMVLTAILVPRKDGRVLLGSTVEWVGYDKRVTLDGRATDHGLGSITCASLAFVNIHRMLGWFAALL